MGLEIEAKFRVDSHRAARKRLAEADGQRLGCAIETDRILDTPDGSLFKRGCGLRIRTVRREDGNQEESALTFKGPRRAGALKVREEIEVPIGDAGATLRIFASLGFHEILCFEKRRETWRLGECLICLDELPHLGLFVEIEGPSEGAVRAARERLQLGGTAAVTATYVGLALAYCEEAQPGERTLVFSGLHQRR